MFSVSIGACIGPVADTEQVIDACAIPFKAPGQERGSQHAWELGVMTYLGADDCRQQCLAFQADSLPCAIVAWEQRRRQRLQPGLAVSRGQQQACQHLLQV